MTTTNGGPAQAGPAPGVGQEQPQLTVVAQYIKDFSFENPRAPQVFSKLSSQPQVQVNVDVDARPLGTDLYEVSLVLNCEAKSGDERAFMAELDYAGLFTLKGFTREQLGPILLIECPRLLFPFAREVIATTVRNGGFPPLLLDPVDFVSLYRQKMAQTQPTSAPAAGS